MSAPVHVERVIAERIREQDQGILTVTDGKVRRLFCVRDGRLIHAASNIIEEQFAEFLVREDLINLAERARSKLESTREGIPELDWLVQEDILAADDLDAALAEHACDLFLKALAAQKAEAKFEKGIPNLEGKGVTDRPLTPLLFTLLKDYPKVHEIRTRIGRPDMIPVRVPDREDDVRELAEAQPSLLQVWSYSHGDLNVAQIVRQIKEGQEVGLRGLYGLVLIGAIDATSEEIKLTQSVHDVPVTRTELLTRLDRAIDADHYAVLELMSGANNDQIQSSYYQLARRYHPDRFRSTELVELMPRIETFFAQVTEAYNTLSDLGLRQQYDGELAAARFATAGRPDP